MKFVSFVKNSLALRSSIVMLSGHGSFGMSVIKNVMENSVRLTYDEVLPIVAADRCAKYIEAFHLSGFSVDSEDYIVALASTYTQDMLGNSLFKPQFSKELPRVRKLLLRGYDEEWRSFKLAYQVISLVNDLQLFRKDEVAILFLVANLIIAESNHLLVLEETDTIDSSLLFSIKMELKRHA